MMADRSVMKITHHISAAVCSGLAITVASSVYAGEMGVGSVELIPFPDATTSFINAYFSGDGQLRLAHTYTEHDSDIYRYADGEWELIRRELRTIVPGITPFDVSADGSHVVLSDFSRVDVLDGPAVFTMPREWTFNEHRNGRTYQQRVHGTVTGGFISGDGQVVTMMGREHDEYSFDSLAWFGDGELVNLNADLPRDEMRYGYGIPNGDGSVIVFAGYESGYPTASSADVLWRWQDGQLTEVPGLGQYESELQRLSDISADGQKVFGTSEGPARGAIAYREIEVAEPWYLPTSNQSTAWVWTASGGTAEIIDRSRFLETSMISADADGTTALIWARPHGSQFSERYLWIGGDTFVELDELFHMLNISIDADFYGFNEISDDGTKLMGLASVDGQIYSHAIIVTIPDLTP